ncbi:hypothetical protein AAMO2058_001722300 [Amorphochlora amoebiformis]
MNKLPKSDEAAIDAEGSPTDSAAATNAALKACYLATNSPFLQKFGKKTQAFETIGLMAPQTETPSPQEEEYYEKFLLPVSLQPRSHTLLAPSLLELNATQVCRAQERQAAFDAGEKSSAEKLDFIRGIITQAFSTEKRIIEQRGKKLQDLMSEMAKTYGSLGEGGVGESQFTRKVAFEEETTDSAQVVESGTVKQISLFVFQDLLFVFQEVFLEKQEKRLAELQEEIKGLREQMDKINRKMEEITSTTRQIEGDVHSNEQEPEEKKSETPAGWPKKCRKT